MEPFLNNMIKRVSADRSGILIALMAVLILILGSYAITGYMASDGQDSHAAIATFTDSGEDVCMVDGKPVVIMFSTTTCPHCTWASPAFEKAAKEYADQGKIIAQHWELDIRDDTLTEAFEGSVPASAMEEFRRISGGGVPAYSMGCRYYRVGNGHERQGDLESEEAEFRAVIERLISGQDA